MLCNRANRHAANEAVAYQGPAPSDDLADQLESRLHHHMPQEWEKYPDEPLGRVVADKARERKIMREHGGREALIFRPAPVKQKTSE